MISNVGSLKKYGRRAVPGGEAELLGDPWARSWGIALNPSKADVSRKLNCRLFIFIGYFLSFFGGGVDSLRFLSNRPRARPRSRPRFLRRPFPPDTGL